MYKRQHPLKAEKGIAYFVQLPVAEIEVQLFTLRFALYFFSFGAKPLTVRVFRYPVQ